MGALVMFKQNTVQQLQKSPIYDLNHHDSIAHCSLQNSTRFVLNSESQESHKIILRTKSCDLASYRTSIYAQFNCVELKGGKPLE